MQLALDRPWFSAYAGYKARFPLPELTTRVDGWPVSITHQHGPCWRVRGFH